MPITSRLCLVAALTACLVVRAGAAETRPNIIVILADDLGYGDLSCYGNTAYETPHLDRLAAGGMRFTDFHSSGAVCSPTRAGLLTGRYQQRAGIPGVVFADPKRNRHHGLHTHEVTFAERVRDAGYATAMFGKWHLGYRTKFNPIRHGFDRFRGYVSGNVDYISHIDQTGVYDWWDGEKLTQEPGYTTHLITKHAVQFIIDNHTRPFCLYVAHEAPHYPFQGPNDPPERIVGNPRHRKGRTDVRAAYKEMVQEMDRGIGEIMRTLRRLDLDRKTFVFFFSDNGATRNGSNGALRGTKGSVWEGGHRVPAIAWWPGRIEPGRVCDDTAISLDVMPTLLAMTGATLPAGHKLDGTSLLLTLTGGKPLGERTLFWAHGQGRAVRRGPWKLVVAKGARGKARLFHLGRDLGEQRDSATQEPERVEALRNALAAWEKDVRTGATVQPEK